MINDYDTQKKGVYVGICLPPMEKTLKNQAFGQCSVDHCDLVPLWSQKFMSWEILVTLGPKVTYTRKISQDCLSILNV